MAVMSMTDELEFGDAAGDDVGEYLRAIEAIVLVAHDPVPPDVLAQLLERPSATSRRGASGSPPTTATKAAASSWSASPAATATRPPADLIAYVERFLLSDQRARLSARRPRDAGDHRLQAADLAGPDRLDPRRRSRRRAAHAAVAGLRRRRRPRPRSRPGRVVRHHGRVPRAARPRLHRRPAADRRVHPRRRRRRGARGRPPRGACRDSRWKRIAATARAQSRRCGSSEPSGQGGERLQKVLAATGWGSRRVCEELIAAGRVRGQRRGRRARPAGRPRHRPDRGRRGAGRQSRPGLVYYLLNKPAGVVTTARTRTGGAPSSTSCPTTRGCSRSAASTPTPRACSCSPTTASSPTASPIRRRVSTRSTSPRSRSPPAGVSVRRRSARCARACSSTTA